MSSEEHDAEARQDYSGIEETIEQIKIQLPEP